MKLEVTEGYKHVLSEVYDGVMIKADNDNMMFICQRDGGFEVGIYTPEKGIGEWDKYIVKDGKIQLMKKKKEGRGDWRVYS